jgi:hypothetical protein
MNHREPRFEIPGPARQVALALMLVGAFGLTLGMLFSSDAVAVHLLLTGFFGVGLGLAGALFVALQYIVGASWSVGVRRVPEAMIALLPASGLLLLVALFAFPSLYAWTDHDIHLHGELKNWWLQRPFFLTRAAAYLVIWTLLALALVRNSRRQDSDGAFQHTIANRRWSALFLVLFGATFWLACYDWLMSREPNWVSTVYGLYHFAGLFTSGWAAFILLVLWLRKLGPYRTVVTRPCLHDLGKLLFGMCVFWLYLWYCQYMLIWFVNNPEETPHYIRRLNGLWGSLFYANVALNGVIPFFVLLPRALKQDGKVLANVCAVVLLGRWLDLFLMIYPENHGALAAGVAVATALGAAGFYFVVFCRALAQAALVPAHDPDVVTSLLSTHHHAHVVHVSMGPAGERM